MLKKEMKMKRYKNILNKKQNPNNFFELNGFDVLGEGLEPSRPEGHRILSPVRLPIPPSEQEYKNKYIFIAKKIYFEKNSIFLILFDIKLKLFLFNLILKKENMLNNKWETVL